MSKAVLCLYLYYQLPEVWFSIDQSAVNGGVTSRSLGASVLGTHNGSGKKHILISGIRQLQVEDHKEDEGQTTGPF